MDDQEWALAARRSQQPCVFHYAVCPHSPETGVLLSEEGRPVLTDYFNVDWKGLAEAAQDQIAGHVPKSVKVYVADDGVDVMDVLNISTETGTQYLGAGFESRLSSTLEKLSMTDMRAGITNLYEKSTGLHLHPPIQGKRPPLGALVISLKFTSGTQVIDYLNTVTDILFGGASFAISIDGFRPEPTIGKMPPYLANWLRSQFGVVYSSDCTFVVMARTFTD